jgi:hypothetical protein
MAVDAQAGEIPPQANIDAWCFWHRVQQTSGVADQDAADESGQAAHTAMLKGNTARLHSSGHV